MSAYRTEPFGLPLDSGTSVLIGTGVVLKEWAVGEVIEIATIVIADPDFR